MKINPMKIFMYDLELTKAEAIVPGEKNRDLTVKMKKKDVLKNVVREFLNGKELVFNNFLGFFFGML